jgi:NAD(P)-dependent dehydrogenase (short-subunit alcohol dehydrogenase family)
VKLIGVNITAVQVDASKLEGLDRIAGVVRRAAVCRALIRQGYAAYTPIGHPDELAAALFLASDESAFMTGSDMAVDGGVSNV